MESGGEGGVVSFLLQKERGGELLYTFYLCFGYLSKLKPVDSMSTYGTKTMLESDQCMFTCLKVMEN